MRFNIKSGLLALAVGSVGFGGAARAATVWSDDFTGEASGVLPTQDFTGNAVNDYSFTGEDSATAAIRINTGVGVAAPSIGIVDTSTGNNTQAFVPMSQFTTFDQANAASARFTVNFDLRVDSYVGSAASNFRFTVQDTNTTNAFTVGLSYLTLNDGDAATNDLALFAGTGTGPTLSDANAVGLTAGTGFASGFDFGNYNGAAGADNDTGDAFYRFSLVFTSGSTTVEGVATRLDAGGVATADTVSFTRTTATAYAFSSNVNDRLILQLPGSGVTTAFVDNISADASPVPEPAGLLALGGAAAALLRRRRA